MEKVVRLFLQIWPWLYRGIFKKKQTFSHYKITSAYRERMERMA